MEKMVLIRLRMFVATVWDFVWNRIVFSDSASLNWRFSTESFFEWSSLLLGLPLGLAIDTFIPGC